MSDWLSMANIISIIAIIFSLIAFIKSWRVKKRFLEIEENRERDRLSEKHKAKLTHSYERNLRKFSKLHINNEGIAKASNIAVYIDDKPLKEWEYSINEDCNFNEIPPENKVTIRVITEDTMKSRWEIHITWEDDSGEPGNYEGFIEIF